MSVCERYKPLTAAQILDNGNIWQSTTDHITSALYLRMKDIEEYCSVDSS